VLELAVIWRQSLSLASNSEGAKSAVERDFATHQGSEYQSSATTVQCCRVFQNDVIQEKA
jgi:hypothetical protein